MAERRCSDCQAELLLSMVSFHAGIWMCSNKLCNFPLNSSDLERYVENFQQTPQEESSCRSLNQVSNRRVPRIPSRTVTTLSSKSTLSSGNSSTCQSNTQVKFPLWKNKETNLCWLDVTLSLFVTNELIKNCLLKLPEEHILKDFISQYEKCKELYKVNKNYQAVEESLEMLRQGVWKYLQPHMALSPGQLDSPLFCLQVLFKKVTSLNEMTLAAYEHEFLCKDCGFEKLTGSKSCCMSIPNCFDDFCIPKKIGFLRECFKCKSRDQQNSILYRKLSDLIVIHCSSGFNKRKFWKDYFPFQKIGEDNRYFVSHIIQYTGTHYILWSFDLKERLWLKADDLEDPVCTFRHKEPNFPSHEANIVVWQKLSKPLDSDKNSTSKMLQKLTLKANSLSSSSSSASFGEDERTSTTIPAKPRMMRNWLKKVETKPLANVSKPETDSKLLKEDNLALSRYKPYVSKKRRGNPSNDDDDDKAVRKDGPLIDPGSQNVSDEVWNPEIRDATSTKTKETLKAEPLFDSAYSSPISDDSPTSNHGIYINTSSVPSLPCSKSSPAKCTLNEALDMVDSLFEGNLPLSLQNVDTLTPADFSRQDSFSDVFGAGIDFDKLF